MATTGYSRTVWATGDVLTATKMNNNEQGITDLDTRRVANY